LKQICAAGLNYTLPAHLRSGLPSLLIGIAGAQLQALLTFG